MTSDQKVQLLSDLMAVREHLASLQAQISGITSALAASDYAENHPDKLLTHQVAFEGHAAAALDEPPSRPL